MPHTVLCELLGIRYPIIQGGMAWCSRAELAAAVSNAGGLGIVGTSTLTVEEFPGEIAKMRRLTDRPWGVNAPLMRPQSAAMIELIERERIPIVITAAGNPGLYTERLKAYGAKVIHVVPSPRLARKAEERGVDVIVCEGFEAGGHDGLEELPTFVLAPLVADSVKVPVVAAGGIADGRGLAAALALGAAGIQMGTRFVAVQENNAHPNFKKALVEADENSTVFVGRAIGPIRVLKNPISLKLRELEFSGAPKEELVALVAGKEFGRKAVVMGLMDEGLFNAGIDAALIRDIPTAGELIERIVAEYREVVGRLPRD